VKIYIHYQGGVIFNDMIIIRRILINYEIYKLNVLPVSLLYDYQVLCFMYSYNNNMLPETFDNLFVQNKSIHNYNTRSANDFRVQYGKTSFTNSNFICRAPELWNMLPNTVKQCSTIKSFKSKLKKHLLQKFIINN